MSIVKKNIAANFGATLWVGLMSLVFVPLYIRFIGIEAYGLMGIFATLLALFSLLDMGLGNTINREMARLSVQENKAQDMRDLLRTLEIPYWAVALLIGTTVIVLSPFIAYRWVNPEALSPDTVQRALMIMGIATALRWPSSLYGGGLSGLQRQVLLNSINVVVETCRGLGAVLILWLVSPTVEAFFTWQILVSAAHTVLGAYFLWRSLPGATEKPRFRSDLLVNIWRFAAGITGISLLSAILMQLDKVILSRILSLEVFGYYSLANVVAINLYRIFGPVFSATYPRLTNLVSLDAREELARLYHKSAQLVSVLTLPATTVIVLFSREILLLWTQDPVTAERTHLLVSILVVGTALNGLMHIPYGLQLASGWTRLTFLLNLVSVLTLVPLMIVLTNWFGAVGAASVWVILNGGYVLFGIQIMHTRLLPSEKWRWYGEDVGLPLLAALATAGAFRLVVPVPAGKLLLFLYLTMVSVPTLGMTALVTPVTRSWFHRKVFPLRVSHATNS